MNLNLIPIAIVVVPPAAYAFGTFVTAIIHYIKLYYHKAWYPSPGEMVEVREDFNERIGYDDPHYYGNNWQAGEMYMIVASALDACRGPAPGIKRAKGWVGLSKLSSRESAVTVLKFVEGSELSLVGFNKFFRPASDVNGIKEK